MTPTDSPGDRLWELYRAFLDAITYALAVTALTAISSLLLGVATGGGIVRAKYLLFVVGWVLLAYATVRLWPTSIDDVGSAPDHHATGSVPGARDSTRFQAFVRTLPPLRWVGPPPFEKRITPPGKLLLGSLFVLLLSFLMETVLGVG